MLLLAAEYMFCDNLEYQIYEKSYQTTPSAYLSPRRHGGRQTEYHIHPFRRCRHGRYQMLL